MTCKTCKIKPVWKFTNQTQLCKHCFIDYIERKVFRTIRKYSMLPENRIILLRKSDNSNILQSILEKKFIVKLGDKFSAETLSEIAEQIFNNISKGNFSGPKPKDSLCRPFYFVSEKELEVYAKLKSLKYTKRKENMKVKSLLNKFSKNPDIEHNIVNAFLQL